LGKEEKTLSPAGNRITNPRRSKR